MRWELAPRSSTDMDPEKWNAFLSSVLESRHVVIYLCQAGPWRSYYNLTITLLCNSIIPAMKVIHRVKPVMKLIETHITTASQTQTHVKWGTIKSSLFQKNGKHESSTKFMHVTITFNSPCTPLQEERNYLCGDLIEKWNNYWDEKKMKITWHMIIYYVGSQLCF